MGGFGSGQRWSKKAVVEGCYSIDTARMKRWKLLIPGTNRSGSFEWRRGDEEKPSSSVSYRISVGQSTGTLRLLYALKSANADLDYPIQLVTTGCHLGGVRWWFICPLVKNGVACGRRVRKLYLRGKYFGCRHCHGLTYTSCQESDSRVYAALRNGLDLETFDRPGPMAVKQLALALKALTIEQKRFDRLGKKLDRSSGRRKPEEDPG